MYSKIRTTSAGSTRHTLNSPVIIGKNSINYDAINIIRRNNIYKLFSKSILMLKFRIDPLEICMQWVYILNFLKSLRSNIRDPGDIYLYNKYIHMASRYMYIMYQRCTPYVLIITMVLV